MHLFNLQDFCYQVQRQFQSNSIKMNIIHCGQRCALLKKDPAMI